MSINLYWRMAQPLQRVGADTSAIRDALEQTFGSYPLKLNKSCIDRLYAMHNAYCVYDNLSQDNVFKTLAMLLENNEEIILEIK